MSDIEQKEKSVDIDSNDYIPKPIVDSTEASANKEEETSEDVSKDRTEDISTIEGDTGEEEKKEAKGKKDSVINDGVGQTVKETSHASAEGTTPVDDEEEIKPNSQRDYDAEKTESSHEKNEKMASENITNASINEESPAEHGNEKELANDTAENVAEKPEASQVTESAVEVDDVFNHDLKETISLPNDMESIDSNLSVIHRPNLPQREIPNTLPTLPSRDISPTHAELPKTPTDWFTFNNSSDFDKTAESISSPVNLNMAYHRFAEREIESKSEADQTDVVNSRNSLKKTFNDIKAGVSHDDVLVNSIDWEFWSLVSNDYNEVVSKKQAELKKNITAGIPNEIRGMIWQIISDSNSIKLKEFFINTKEYKSDFASLIRRDLVRTRFIKDSQINDKLDDLFNVIKTYSLYDTEVGYTQGMAFITVPLLMNMESDEAFCALVRLMFTYGFRDFFLPEMPGLHLRMYQFDRLLEDYVPDLYQHLQNESVKSSMYAIQWFLTLFAYKFPLAMVLRIFDVVIAEGLESILKFGLNLMIKNHDHLLTLKFEELLDFLKEKVFCYYSETSGAMSEETNVKGVEDNKSSYKIDEFIKDSMEINILPLTLNKYRCEYDEVTRLEQENSKKVLNLQSQNGSITKEIRKIEANYAILNKEHMEIANEMVNGKMAIGSLEEENKSLEVKIQELKQRLENLQSSAGSTGVDFTSDSTVLSDGLDKEVQKVMEVNLEVMDQNQVLEEELAQLEQDNERLKTEKGSHIGSMFKLKKGKFWSK